MVDMHDRLRALAEDRLPCLNLSGAGWRFVGCACRGVRCAVSNAVARAGPLGAPSWFFVPVDGEPDDADYRQMLRARQLLYCLSSTGCPGRYPHCLCRQPDDEFCGDKRIPI